jgi:hypothetical protein
MESLKDMFDTRATEQEDADVTLMTLLAQQPPELQKRFDVGQLQERLCDGPCGGVPVSHPTTQDPWFQVGTYHTAVDQAMRSILAPGDEAVDSQCPKCRSIGCMRKRTMHLQTAQVLVVHIGRHNRSSNRTTKNMRAVTYPMVLRHPQDPSVKYSLRAVIVHLGRSYRSGHYVAAVHHAGKWWRCDDDDVQEMPSDPGEHKLVHMLFYELDEGSADSVGGRGLGK